MAFRKVFFNNNPVKIFFGNSAVKIRDKRPFDFASLHFFAQFNTFSLYQRQRSMFLFKLAVLYKCYFVTFPASIQASHNLPLINPSGKAIISMLHKS
jgi:hypothetical protein